MLDNVGLKESCYKGYSGSSVSSRVSVKVGGRVSERFDVHREVRQGCTLSPWLFNLIIYRQCNEGGKRKFYE